MIMQLQGLLCRLRLIAPGSSINGYHQLIPHPAGLLIPRSTSVKLEKNPTQHQILSSKLNTEDYYFRCCRWKFSLFFLVLFTNLLNGAQFRLSNNIINYFLCAFSSYPWRLLYQLRGWHLLCPVCAQLYHGPNSCVPQKSSPLKKNLMIETHVLKTRIVYIVCRPSTLAVP